MMQSELFSFVGTFYYFGVFFINGGIEFREELLKRSEKFDVIIGDLADPLEGGPCNHLYTKTFYEEVLKPKLNDSGIFVTQVTHHSILEDYYYIYILLNK